jgi:hypothetical protein
MTTAASAEAQIVRGNLEVEGRLIGTTLAQVVGPVQPKRTSPRAVDSRPSPSPTLADTVCHPL